MMRSRGAYGANRPLTVDVASLGLDELTQRWVRERCRSLLPTTTQIDVLEFGSGPLSDADAKMLRRLRFAMTPSADNATVDVAGKTTTGTIFQTRAAVYKGTESAAIQKMRADLSGAFVGQDRDRGIEAFCRWQRDAESPTRASPPVIALSGPIGHGKDVPLAALAGDKGPIRRVDLRDVTDSSAAALFDEDGMLGVKALKDTFKKLPLLHLTGLDDLQARAPKVCYALQELLLGELYTKTRYAVVCEFDVPGKGQDTLDLMFGALGTLGPRLISSDVSFQPLDAAAMTQYARTRLTKILDRPEYANVQISVEEDAWRCIGEALATPDAPLDQLDARLERLLITHLLAFARAGDFFKVNIILEPGLAPETRQEIVENLRSLKPAFQRGEEMFAARVVARGDQPETRAQLEQMVKTIADSVWPDRAVLQELHKFASRLLPLVRERAHKNQLSLVSNGEHDELLRIGSMMGAKVPDGSLDATSGQVVRSLGSVTERANELKQAVIDEKSNEGFAVMKTLKDGSLIFGYLHGAVVVNTNKRETVIEGHTDEVRGAVELTDGTLLTIGADKRAFGWNLAARSPQQFKVVLSGLPTTTTALPEGRYAVGFEDGSTRVYLGDRMLAESSVAGSPVAEIFYIPRTDSRPPTLITTYRGKAADICTCVRLDKPDDQTGLTLLPGGDLCDALVVSVCDNEVFTVGIDNVARRYNRDLELVGGALPLLTESPAVLVRALYGGRYFVKLRNDDSFLLGTGKLGDDQPIERLNDPSYQGDRNYPVLDAFSAGDGVHDIIIRENGVKSIEMGGKGGRATELDALPKNWAVRENRLLISSTTSTVKNWQFAG